MGEMADGSRDFVMLAAVYDNGDGVDIPGDGADGLDPFLRQAGRCRNNIVGILHEKGAGVGVPAPLGACHGVAAYKSVRKAEPLSRLVDAALYASYVSDHAVL